MTPGLSKHKEFFDYVSAQVILIIGARKSGKSTYLERILEGYFNKGWITMHLWSAQDQENLFWCVMDKLQYPIILIHNQFKKIHIPERYKDLVKPMPDNTPLIQILRTAKKERRVVCLDISSYDTKDARHEALSRILHDIIPVNQNELHSKIIIGLSEAYRLVYSGEKDTDKAKKSKITITDFAKECRHHNIWLVMDTHQYGEVFHTIRKELDRIVIKQSTPEMLDKLQWVLQKIRKYQLMGYRLPNTNNLWPNRAYHVWNDRHIKLLPTKLPTFHHKTEGEYFSKITGIHYESQEEEVEVNLENEIEDCIKNGLQTAGEIRDALNLNTNQTLDLLTRMKKLGLIYKVQGRVTKYGLSSEYKQKDKKSMRDMDPGELLRWAKDKHAQGLKGGKDSANVKVGINTTLKRYTILKQPDRQKIIDSL